MKIFHIALYTLLQRKRWLALLLGITTLTIVAVVSVVTATESIQGALLEKSYAKYGQHHSVVIQADPAVKQQLAEWDAVDTIGEFGLVGTTFIDETQPKEATVGWFDHEAVRLGHLNLKEGRMPETAGEIAIEAYYAQATGFTWGIDEHTTLQIDGEEQGFRVVGIVSDYSSRWSTDFNVVRGVNDYPNIFLSAEDVQRYDNLHTNLLISFDGSIKQVLNRANELHFHLPSESQFKNQRLLNEGLRDYGNLSMLMLVFQVMIIMAAVICMVSLFSFYFISQERKLAIFRACGATQGQLYVLVFLQSTMVFLISSSLVIPLISGAHQGLVALTYGEGNIQVISAGWVLLWTLILFSTVVIIALWSVSRKRNNSISEMLRDSQSAHRGGSEGYFEQAPFWIRKVYVQMVQSWKQSIGNVACLSVIICIVFVALFIALESSETVADGDPDYSMNAQTGYKFKTMHGLFVLGAGELVYAPDDVSRLEKLPGVRFADKTPFMVDVHPLLTDDQLTPTLKAEANFYLEAEDDDVPSRASLGIPEQVTAVPDVQYLFVDKQEYEDIYVQHFGSDGDYESFANEQVLLFIPEEEEELVSLTGETIQFGQLRREETGDLTFNHWEYEIQNVHIGPFQRTITDHVRQERDGVVIVMDKERAANNHLLRGYNRVALYMQSDVSEEEQAHIEQLGRGLAASVPGIYFKLVSESIEEDQRIVSFLKTLTLGMFVITLVFSAISIVTVIFSRFIVRRQEWGIYFATGMNRNMMRLTVQGELFVYWVMAVVVSLLVCTVFIVAVPNYYPYSQYFIYFLFAVISAFVPLFVSGIAVTQLMTRHSILSLLRVTE